MHSSLPFPDGPWLEPLLVLAVGAVAIVALAAVAGRLACSAVWQRTIWQAATLGLLALLLVESTGTAAAFLHAVRAAAGAPRSEPHATAAPPLERGGRFTPQPAAVVLSAAEGVEAGGDFHEPGMWLPLSEPLEAPLELDLPAEAFVSEAAVVPTLSGASPVGQASRPSGTPMTPGDPRPEPDSTARQDQWWVVLIWLFGAAAMAGRFAWARVLLAAFRRRQRVVSDDGLRRRVAKLARRLGLRHQVSLLEAAGLRAPVAFGVFRPTLALPAAFSRNFGQDEQEAMIAHELAHLAARDPAWQLAADLMCVFLWWHPLAWFARRRLRFAGEAAADEASLLLPEGPDLLASCLIALGQQLVGPRRQLGWLSVEGAGFGSGFRSGLGRRVERLLRLSGRTWRPPRRKSLAAARLALPLMLVIVAVFSTAWAHPQATFSQGETTMSVLNSSWRQSLAAAAVMAFLGSFSADAIGQDRPENVRVVAPAPDAPAERPEREAPPRERGDRPQPEREALHHEIEVLGIALGAAREANRGDAVELLERAVHARQVALEGRRDDEAAQIRERAPNPGQLAEVLQMAAGLLRERGKAEGAEAVAQLAERLRGEGQRRRDADRPREEGRQREADRPARERPREEAEAAHAREREELMRRLNAEREELRAKAEDIERKLKGLRDDQDAEARELQKQLAQVNERMAAIEREARQLAGRRGPEAVPPREAMARRLNELKEALERARQAGRGDEAERLERQLHEIAQAMERRGREGPPPEAREEMERRMQHVRVAVENLHAAGLHEQAEQLAQQMERLLRGRPEAGPPDRFPPPSPPRREGPPPEGLEGVLRELTGQIRQLQDRLEQSARQNEAVVERIEARANELEARVNQLQQRLEAISAERAKR